jgi:hypothetical protein
MSKVQPGADYSLVHVPLLLVRRSRPGSTPRFWTKKYLQHLHLREPDEAIGIRFFHPDSVNRSNRAFGFSFSFGSGSSSIRRAQAILGLPGRARNSERKKRTRNGEENSRASCGPDLAARVGGRRPYRLLFRASSSSLRIVFRAL